jgi:hydroxymethylglutaryl-CoA lyase
MKIIECPRDAMQGITNFIPTDQKVKYLNELLHVGFDTLDFGSFVSPKAIPQMRDTRDVVQQLNLDDSTTKLLAIVANTRGAEDAGTFDQISYLGFPLSISETFQLRNTNKSISDALNELSSIKNICEKKGKRLVTYISMGFGNPYGDPYDVSMVSGFLDILITLGSDVISIADTIGAATPLEISALMSSVLKQYSTTEIGVHLHSKPENAYEKIQAALQSGCRRFDGALKGYGGCPMAKDELVGNIDTEIIVQAIRESGVLMAINDGAFRRAIDIADQIFPKR